MKSSHHFITLCNRLNDLLVDTFHLSKHTTLGQAIRQTRYKDPMIKRFYEDLIDYADLRNVLVHNKQHNVYLAEPNQEVIETLMHVIRVIENPKKVKDYFVSEVKTLSSEMTLLEVMHMIKVTRYSHYPVYENQTCIGILTDNGIVHFLADNHISHHQYKDVQVKQLLASDEHSQAFKYVSKEQVAYTLLEELESHEHALKVFLVLNQMTDQTRKSLVGMILPKDMFKVVKDMLMLKEQTSSL
jgi:predicted transcriptional regulator